MKLKIKIKNPLKAVAKVLTAPVVVPTKMAVSQISEKAAAGIGGSLGYSKTENKFAKMAGKVGVAVAGGAAVKAITSAPAVSALSTKAEGISAIAKAKTAGIVGMASKAKKFGSIFKSAGENSADVEKPAPAQIDPAQQPAVAVQPRRFFLARWLDSLFGIER